MNKILFHSKSIVIIFILIGIFSSNLAQKNLRNFIRVNFDQSMGKGIHFSPRDYYRITHTEKKRLELLNFFRSIYNKRSSIEPYSEPLIPLIIHDIWLGPNTPPASFKLWQASWLKLHPKWRYILWTDNDVKKIKLINQDLYDLAINWGEKSDILRIELLNQFGGLYKDVDFECLKPFDELHYLFDFYTGIGPFDKTPFYIGNGLIASSPGHPIIQAYIDGIKYNHGKTLVADRTGPPFFIKLLHQMLNNVKYSRSIALPSSYFYPVERHQKTFNKQQKQALCQSESMAIHHWAASWNCPKGYVDGKKPPYRHKGR